MKIDFLLFQNLGQREITFQKNKNKFKFIRFKTIFSIVLLLLILSLSSGLEDSRNVSEIIEFCLISLLFYSS